MLKGELELLQRLDKKISYVSEVCGQIQTNTAEIATLKNEIADINGVVDEFREVVLFRKKLKRIMNKVLVAALIAGATTFINNSVNTYFINRDDHGAAPTKVETTNGSVG